MHLQAVEQLLFIELPDGVVFAFFFCSVLFFAGSGGSCITGGIALIPQASHNFRPSNWTGWVALFSVTGGRDGLQCSDKGFGVVSHLRRSKCKLIAIALM